MRGGVGDEGRGRRCTIVCTIIKVNKSHSFIAKTKHTIHTQYT